MPAWYDSDRLYKCWVIVKQKGTQGGIDNISIDRYKLHLRRKLNKLSSQLRKGEYIPEPGRQIKLKKSDGGLRTICMTTIEDKIVQTAVKQEIEPLFEKEFLSCSYAYRPGRGHRKAIHNIDHYLSQKMHWITTCDIDNFFDSIDHTLLINQLQKKVKDNYVLSLIKMWLTIGAFSGDRYYENKQGAPQGGVISPLLSNIYLHPFDLEMQKRKAHYIRYADDFIVLEKTKTKAEQHYMFIEKYLQNQLHLQLNRVSESVLNISDGFVFLGIHFQNTQKTIARKKLRKALNNIEKLFKQAIGRPFADTINQLNEKISSWLYYYGECENDVSFTVIQNKIFDRIAHYVSRMAEEGKLPERNYLQGNLSRLQLLVPLPPAQKQKIFKQVLSGKIKSVIKNASLKPEIQKSDSEYPPSKGAKREKTLTQAEIKRAVAVKKRKYQRKFFSEYDLVLSSYGTFLGRHLQRLVVKQGNAKLKEFAVSKVKHVLVLNSSVTISSAAIYLCSQNNIPIDFLDYQGKPFARLAAPERPAWRFGLYQLEALTNKKGMVLARAFVLGKIKNQINLMKYFSKYRKLRDKDFMELFNQETALLKSYIDEIEKLEKCVSLEKMRGSLLGIEGRAGAAYWKLVRGLIEDRIEFKKRERRGARDLFNSLLNYGYGILYSRVWGALMLAGLNVQISFLHCPQYEKPTLVYDAVEEFRAQVVDRVVISLITRGEKLAQNSKGYLTKESKDKLIENIFERLNTPIKFRKKQRTMQEIIQYQARAMGNYLKEGRPAYRPFIAKW